MSNDGGLPDRLWIGVTGHRVLDDPEAIVAQVRIVLDELTSAVGPDVVFGVVSPLAEGADRLVASEVLARPRAVLELAMPMPTDDYLEDFGTPESRDEFHELRDRASLITVMAPSGRVGAYAWVGRYVVERCDVLIAVWDGQKANGPGGTGEIVELARDRKVPLYWIHADGSGVARPKSKIERRLDIDHFNQQKLSAGSVAVLSSALQNSLVSAGRDTGLDETRLAPYLDWIVPHMVRADLLASRYQRLYRHAGSFLFAGSFLAVAVAAYQALFQPELVRLVWLEAFAMVSLLLVLYLAKHYQLHNRWLGYRCLAEQFRSGLFLAVAGIGQARTESGPAAAAELPKVWVPRLFDELWMARPRDLLPQTLVRTVRDFIIIAWLDDQIAYNVRAQRHNRVAEVVLKRVVAALFGATLLVAIAHAAEISEGGHHWMEFASILLPAAAAALHGIRSQRDYVRNADRAMHLREGLAHIRIRLKTCLPEQPIPPEAADEAESQAQIQKIVTEAAQLMLAENREWFGTMRHHDLEIQV
jgi:hypothetical protein